MRELICETEDDVPVKFAFDEETHAIKIDSDFAELNFSREEFARLQNWFLSL